MSGLLERRPSREVSIAVAAALVAIWGYLRLVLFDTSMFPLTYALPLLICVWTRDRLVLWAMAAIFVVFHTVKIFYLLPAGAISEPELWANYGATLVNVTVGAAAVHGIIMLRDSLDRTLNHVRAQAEELRAQGEELAQQNEELSTQAEELSQQTEELTQQGEELVSQNEELQSQTEEIGTLMAALERRETLLQKLLETARLSGTEGAALRHTVVAGHELFGRDGVAVAVYERAASGLELRALAESVAVREFTEHEPCVDHFVDLVCDDGRVAALGDVALRPDLAIARFADGPAARAVLCAPICIGDGKFGAFAVYRANAHEWSDEEFRLAEWLADQCARVIQTLRVQSDLRSADRRKTEFLATLSHELRNPLAAIGFALKLLEKNEGREPQAQRVMQRQLQQLVRLVDDLLDAARLTSNKIQIRKARVDLVPIVQHAVDALRPEVDAAKHALQVAVPQEPLWVDADPERISQVVTNLLSNAIRYTSTGGALGVSLTAGAAEIVLTVTDSGVGIDNDDLERVFEMFTQVGGPGSGGLGIGLALVRGVAELHGGRAEAYSAGAGAGSEFRVTLPRAPGTAREQSALEAEAPSGESYRVLVVDDNVDSAAMVGALLESFGHVTKIAHTGADALWFASDFRPDAALLDIGLPDVNGYELARKLRADPATRNMRLIALTGWGQAADRSRALEAGFDAHLSKPAGVEMILAALRDTGVRR